MDWSERPRCGDSQTIRVIRGFPKNTRTLRVVLGRVVASCAIAQSRPCCVTHAFQASTADMRGRGGHRFRDLLVCGGRACRMDADLGSAENSGRSDGNRGNPIRVSVRSWSRRLALSITRTPIPDDGPCPIMKHYLQILAVAACLAATTAVSLAETKTFNFKDPKGVNNAVFTLDAPLEAITGSANGISGSVAFDPARPEATQGKIVVAAASLHVPNPVMKEHLHGETWMHVAKYPEITFVAKKLTDPKTVGDLTTGMAHGTLTIRGVSRETVVPVRLTFLKDKLAARTNGQSKGDLLVLRAQFAVKRSDFGINPKAPEDKVSDTIELSLSVAGAAPQS
jgi:polyisoprenoid-binding protein YceI